MTPEITTNQPIEAETSPLQPSDQGEASVTAQAPSTPLPTLSQDWLDAIAGSMRDEPAFDEVVALGRAFRYADRPDGDEPL